MSCAPVVLLRPIILNEAINRVYCRMLSTFLRYDCWGRLLAKERRREATLFWHCVAQNIAFAG